MPVKVGEKTHMEGAKLDQRFDAKPGGSMGKATAAEDAFFFHFRDGVKKQESGQS